MTHIGDYLVYIPISMKNADILCGICDEDCDRVDKIYYDFELQIADGELHWIDYYRNVVIFWDGVSRINHILNYSKAHYKKCFVFSAVALVMDN